LAALRRRRGAAAVKNLQTFLCKKIRPGTGSNQYSFNVEPGMEQGLYNVQPHKAPTGNSIEAALRRLRSDDRPIAKELHAKVLAGELSPHGAVKLAGYRKDPDPRKQILRADPEAFRYATSRNGGARGRHVFSEIAIG
jgi:hypothetical protein